MKKPREYTEIKKETIVGVLSYFLILLIVVVTYDLLIRLVYQKGLADYIFSPSVPNIWLSLIVFGVVILAMTTMLFMVTESILVAKERLPKFEKVYRIWNPLKKTRPVINEKGSDQKMKHPIKPPEYTKIKKETIAGVFGFMVSLGLFWLMMETITDAVCQKNLSNLIMVSNVPIISFIFMVLISLAGAMIIFILLVIIMAKANWYPDIEGHIKIWNPFNKTRIIIDKRNNRPYLVYFLRRPQDLIEFLIPNWIFKRWEKIIFPVLFIGVIFILWANNMANPEWVRQWIGIPLSLLFLVLCAYIIFYVIISQSWPDKRAIVTQEEYDEMIPHLKKWDVLAWGSELECYYKSRMWIVSQEDYDQIVSSLKNKRGTNNGL